MMPVSRLVPIPAPAKWAMLALVGAWLVWRIVFLGMANLESTRKNDPEAALGWYSSLPGAHRKIGVRDLEARPENALRHLRAAVDGNPVESRNYAALGQLLEKGGADDLARKAMETAAKLAPQRSDVQLDLTAYWARQGNFPRALQHWNTVLRHQPALRQRLFPYLLNGAEDPANLPAFKSLLSRPVPWWTEFFVHAATHATRPETVRALYELTHEGANELPPEAFGAYLARLQKEGSWTEAWFVWLNSLSRQELGQSAYVFNGSFERRPTNIGFDWIYQKTPAVVMDTTSTYGTTGERALNLVFRGVRVKFEHLYQYLLLPPGTYFLQGRARPDNLKAAQGMQWALYCLGERVPLTVSERFTGQDQWTRFRSQFTVPAGCPVQMLRLELAGKIALDYDVSGGIWFDDIAVEQAGRGFGG